MPTYEYRCKDCGEQLEVVQSFQDDALTECPSCGGTLRKVFGSIGITFKGSGFYKNDSRSTASSTSSSPESTSSSSDGAKTSDTKTSSDAGSSDASSGSKDSSSASSSSSSSSSSSGSGDKAKSA